MLSCQPAQIDAGAAKKAREEYGMQYSNISDAEIMVMKNEDSIAISRLREEYKNLPFHFPSCPDVGELFLIDSATAYQIKRAFHLEFYGDYTDEPSLGCYSANGDSGFEGINTAKARFWAFRFLKTTDAHKNIMEGPDCFKFMEIGGASLFVKRRVPVQVNLSRQSNGR